MVNKVTLIGNLGRDPELFQTQSGQSVARLSIATNEVWMKEGGTSAPDRVAPSGGVGSASRTDGAAPRGNASVRRGPAPDARLHERRQHRADADRDSLAPTHAPQESEAGETAPAGDGFRDGDEVPF